MASVLIVHSNPGFRRGLTTELAARHLSPLASSNSIGAQTILDLKLKIRLAVIESTIKNEPDSDTLLANTLIGSGIPTVVLEGRGNRSARDIHAEFPGLTDFFVYPITPQALAEHIQVYLRHLLPQT